MATDVDVQFFSHSNGLTLGNNWGDLIRMLDKTLVTGVEFSQITNASIDDQGDVHITLYSNHKALLLQVVELVGFAPGSLNQKYRIKGLPSSNELILKPQNDIIERIITTIGAAKLASLGYEIIFRDSADVKRVYRAINPEQNHPFIRVDETISDGVNSYASTYAKYAMVGLIENMTHVDDYEDSAKLQLPYDSGNLKKNWSISGTGASVIRGWSKWYYSRAVAVYLNGGDTSGGSTSNRKFSIIGNRDAFYMPTNTQNEATKIIYGCGVFDANLATDFIPNWFLMSSLGYRAASISFSIAEDDGGSPLQYREPCSRFIIPAVNMENRYISHTSAKPITPDYRSGLSGLYVNTSLAALNIPFSDMTSRLRGSLKHVYYAGNHKSNVSETTPILSDSSMYIFDLAMSYADGNYAGGMYYYLGDLL